MVHQANLTGVSSGMARCATRARFSRTRTAGTVLAFALAGAWVFSFMGTAEYAIAGREWTWNCIDLAHGSIRLCHRDNHTIPSWFSGLRDPEVFAAATLGEVSIFDPRYVAVPLWIPLIIVAAPTVLLWWRSGSYAVSASGRPCRSCRYDLSGQPTATVCPECGSPA